MRVAMCPLSPQYRTVEGTPRGVDDEDEAPRPFWVVPAGSQTRNLAVYTHFLVQPFNKLLLL